MAWLCSIFALQTPRRGQENPSASLHKLANRMPCSGKKRKWMTLICLLQPVPPRSAAPPSLSSGLLFPPIRLQGQACLVLSDASFPHPTHRSACHVEPHADWFSEGVERKGNTNQEGANSEAQKAGFDDTEGGNGPWSLFPPGSYKKCPSPATSRLVLLVYGPDGGGCDEESPPVLALGFSSGLPSFFLFSHPSCHFFSVDFCISPACFFLFGCDLVGLPCRRLTPLLHTLTDSYIVWEPPSEPVMLPAKPTSGFRRPSRKSSEGQWKASKASFSPLLSPSNPPCAIAAASPTLGRWWPLSLPSGARVTSLSGRSHDNAQRTCS
ncbi:uncharacterized protein BO96DRAFT_330292 [Aspergillus niger CBS 101883]|uniref:uncharacterized protein n=1 Tax=Aspergillus lacticoffeatus (strain CBS 101883) TaxID=1450533 RepID=UPI000D7FC7D6|nr:uncharacterized protein BO96DRAFT_330292 [Aspergillus niger CBS 101883]PYH59272.1 hypothetical protein BO96DRAFT_330292 [Aspergillus niger CBS 101883]